jgi:FAD:protein FMN transferase
MAEYRVEQVMGMDVSVDVRDDLPVRVLAAAFAWFRQVDRLFTPFDDESEIRQIARGTLAPAAASPLVRDVLERCEVLRAFTGGFFDPAATGKLDPSGFVKGWSVERAAEILERAGARQFSINAGGDAVVRGGAPWRVGIQHPLERRLLAGVIELADAAVATSGAYERGSHIVDPQTGKAPRGVLSVTVIGPDLASADAYATAAFAMGPAGPAWTASIGAGYEAMSILANGRVLCTPGFLARCPGGSPTARLRP